MEMTALYYVVGLAVPLAITVGYYNRLVRLRTMKEEGWSGIEVQLKRRHDLVPNVVAAVKGYQVHELEVLESLAKARERSISGPVGARAAAEGDLAGALRTLFAVAEDYPELKADQNFRSLQQELSKLEDELQLARRYYNGSARDYNIAAKTFPGVLVARAFGFAEAEFFEADESARAVPTVAF